MSYVFNRNFDESESPDREIAYTSAEFEQARAEARTTGYDEGYRQGQADARRAAMDSQSERRLKLAETAVPVLRALLEDADRHRAALEAQMIEFIESVFAKVAPDVSAALAQGQARREAKAAIRMALGAAQLRLTFPPDDLQAATVELEEAAREAGFAGRLVIEADPALKCGDMHAAWDQGVMSYSFAEICTGILDVLGMSRQQIAQRLGEKPTGEPS